MLTECGDFFCGDTILIAAGYFSRELVHTVGIDVPMQKALLEGLVTEAEPPMFEQMLGTAMADFYGHQTPHGSFVFGGHSGMEWHLPEYAKNGSADSHVRHGAQCRARDIELFPAS